MNEQEEAGWKVSERETLFENSHLALEEMKIASPHQSRLRSWTIVRRKRAVVIAPMTDDGKLVLIRQERIPIQQAIWEMPAGQIDDRNAQGEAAAREVALKELVEETGYELADKHQLISLGDFFSSPGFTDEMAHLFLAQGVRPSAKGDAPEESESILECREFSPQEISQMIADNIIQDANTLSVCARLVARGFLSLARS